MNVRHATLLDVTGRPAKYGGFTIVPARFDLEGTRFGPGHHLNQLPSHRIPPVLRVPIEQHYDVAWVRARLPAVFGISPEPTDVEKALLSEGFVAVRDGSAEAVPFDVSDYYGKTSLTFSPAEEDERLKADVGEAFWAVLLAEPDQLADFRACVSHVGAGVMLNYGCEDGEPYCYESTEADGDE